MPALVRLSRRFVIAIIASACFIPFVTLTNPAAAADDLPFTRTRDVVYGRKHGMALTCEVFTPKENPNGAAVIWVVSGGWFSNHAIAEPGFPFSPINELVKRG